MFQLSINSRYRKYSWWRKYFYHLIQVWRKKKKKLVGSECSSDFLCWGENLLRLVMKKNDNKVTRLLLYLSGWPSQQKFLCYVSSSILYKLVLFSTVKNNFLEYSTYFFFFFCFIYLFIYFSWKLWYTLFRNLILLFSW